MCLIFTLLKSVKILGLSAHDRHQGPLPSITTSTVVVVVVVVVAVVVLVVVVVVSNLMAE